MNERIIFKILSKNHESKLNEQYIRFLNNINQAFYFMNEKILRMLITPTIRSRS